MPLTITAHGWVTLTTCAGELALALLALLRGAPGRFALLLALFSLDLFFWNFATLAYEVSGIPAWHWLDHATSPLCAPLALHFVVGGASSAGSSLSPMEPSDPVQQARGARPDLTSGSHRRGEEFGQRGDVTIVVRFPRRQQ